MRRRNMNLAVLGLILIAGALMTGDAQAFGGHRGMTYHYTGGQGYWTAPNPYASLPPTYARQPVSTAQRPAYYSQQPTYSTPQRTVYVQPRWQWPRR